MTRLRITHILASVDDPGAGPSYSAVQLASELHESDAEVLIRCVAGWRGAVPIVEVNQKSSVRIARSVMSRNLFSRSTCGSSQLRHALEQDARSADILHTHGLWLMPNIYPSWAAKIPGARAKVMLSPRGMLSEAALKFSRIKKSLFWAFVQQRALETVSVLHATSEAEIHDIRSAGLKLPVALIPNGVDLPDIAAPAEPRIKEILYLGRLHPKKGIDILIRAWGAIATRRPEWRLRLIGPSEDGYDSKLRQLVAKLQVPRVSIEGPAYGPDRLAAYRRASLFALPTLNENFGMVVAEALAAELPVICSRGAPWSDLSVKKCGWWVETDVEPFSDALEEATGKTSSELADMGARGRAWMARDFGWSGIASDMLAVYRWLADGGSPPQTIRFG